MVLVCVFVLFVEVICVMWIDFYVYVFECLNDFVFIEYVFVVKFLDL